MSEKHYDINYLQNSRRLLLTLKEASYNYFEKINSGTIIDLGCGAGKDVIELAKIVGNDTKVIGIDHDPVMLEQGKTDAKDLPNVAFILSEAYPLQFGSETIAGLRTERVVQHLKEPQKVINEIARILKPGSPFVIIETDWHSLSFYTPFADTQQKINAYLTNQKVNNGFAARKLTNYLKQSNFKDIKFEIHPFILGTLEEANQYLWVQKMAQETAEKGFITTQEYEEFYNALQQADTGGYFACSINLVVATCIK
ncbi:methyltransferase domain-containing protein [Mucilaginibacter sp. dw_454]|uniref:methyltransferase domain-containing protein n=1 Tax=Mucilaginibacter sp. dw_454 TaxID=2720079 RepID=UPI001BD50DFB|nr:methyltransferase domain-containing protein [Mucilaginibacter sp. dw_454]